MTTLRPGDRGAEVEQLQAQLCLWGAELLIDGIYGPDTEGAVRALQESVALRVDGIAGPATISALMQSRTTP